MKGLVSKFNTWRTSKKKYYCPVCENYSAVMLPFGYKPRPNAQCPHCFSLERHRLVWLYLKQKTNFCSDRLRVLHLAPERCFKLKFEKMSNLDYITVDLFSPLAKLKMDITELAFSDQVFDVILCSHVLEHIQKDRLAMKELNRVLKPRGWGILQVPIRGKKTLEMEGIHTKEDRIKYYGQADHVRFYGEDYTDRLESEGFSVKVDAFVKSLSQKEIEKMNLNSSEMIYFVKRS